MSFTIIIVKTPFFNSLLISLYYKSINKAFYIKTNIFTSGSSFISTFAKVR
jgi:hypothetical protein